jgi:hypothetical protein
MGEGSERVAASGDSKNNHRGSCEAHNVSSCPQEDWGVSAGKVGESEGATEKGRLDRTSHLTPTDRHESPTVD